MVKACVYRENNNSSIDIFFENENIVIKFLNEDVTIEKVESPDRRSHYLNCPQVDFPDAFYEEVIELSNTQEKLSNALKRMGYIYSGVIADL